MAQTSGSVCKMMLALLTIVCGTLVAAEFPIPEPVNPQILHKRAKDYRGTTSNQTLVTVGPKKYVFTKEFSIIGPVFYNYKPKPNDVYLVSFPRAGHNWVSQLIWLLVNNISIAEAKAKPLSCRVPLLENSKNLKIGRRPNGDYVVSDLVVDALPSPRVIRTQLPFSLIPKIANSSNKIIYLARNYKDTMVSAYKYVQAKPLYNFVGSIERYWYWCQRDLNMYSPYWAHIKEGLSRKGQPNVLVVFAGEKPKKLIKKISHFLGKKYSKKQLKNLSAYLKSIEQIDQVSWKKVFSPELNKQVNAWIKANRGNIKFPHMKRLLSNKLK